MTFGLPNLVHNGKTVIVSRFTILTENCTICCYEGTKLFSSSYLVSGAFSARNPCNVGPFAYLAISVLRKVRKNAVLSRYQAACLMSRFVQRLSSSTESCANSSSHSSRSRNGSLTPNHCLHFLCLFLVSHGSRNWSPGAGRRLRPFRVFAGPGEESPRIGSW